VPRLAKITKTTRDRAVLKGLPALMAGRAHLVVLEERLSREEIAARIEAHLRAMERVAQLTMDLRVAVQNERAIEAALLPFLAALEHCAVGTTGRYDARLRDRGFEPHRKPVMTAETKAVANAKRQATRVRRGIVGKKRRRPPPREL
jgi:hypothetical protein